MVDDLEPIRRAPSRHALLHAYAGWMAAHPDAEAWDFREARDLMRRRRYALAMSGDAPAEAPTEARASSGAAAWVEAYLRHESTDEELAARARTTTDFHRRTGPAGVDAVRRVRSMYFDALQDPAVGREVAERMQAWLRHRLLDAPRPTLDGVPGAGRAARRIRDHYGPLYEVMRLLLQPAHRRVHTGPAASGPRLDEQKGIAKKAFPLFIVIWLCWMCVRSCVRITEGSGSAPGAMERPTGGGGRGDE